MKCIHPTLISRGKRSYYVPCGRCAWCRRRKQDEWFFRLSFESRLWPYVSFVTLTYDDVHIPTMAVDSDGAVRWFRGYDFVRPTDVEVKNVCVEQDPVRYFKRLTKRLSFLQNHQRFYQKPSGQFYLKPCKPMRRYVCVPELGSKSGRPHYHFLLFATADIDCSLDWPFGEVVQVPAALGSFRYVTKYLLKGGSEGFSRLMCSRGIGADYVNFQSEVEKFFQDDKVYLPRYLRDRWTKMLDDAFLDYDIEHGLVSADSSHCKAVQVFKDSLMDALFDSSPHSEFESQYLQTHSSLDGFSNWLSDIYKIDARKQFQINSHGKV